MPFVSRQQQKWGHTSSGLKALGGAAKVKEWDKATKGKDLPMRAPQKGSGPVSASYAKGGPVLHEGRDRFMKTPDVFRTDIERNDYPKSGKGGEMSKLEGDKSLKPVKPRT